MLSASNGWRGLLAPYVHRCGLCVSAGTKEKRLPKRVAPENHQARPPDWGSKPGSGNQMTSHASSPLILLVITMYMCIWMCIWMCMAVYVMDGCNVCVSGKACIIYIYIYIYILFRLMHTYRR
jgi:hypothetical protein